MGFSTSTTVWPRGHPRPLRQRRRIRRDGRSRKDDDNNPKLWGLCRRSGGGRRSRRRPMARSRVFLPVRIQATSTWLYNFVLRVERGSDIASGVVSGWLFCSTCRRLWGLSSSQPCEGKRIFILFSSTHLGRRRHNAPDDKLLSKRDAGCWTNPLDTKKDRLQRRHFERAACL